MWLRRWQLFKGSANNTRLLQTRRQLFEGSDKAAFDQRNTANVIMSLNIDIIKLRMQCMYLLRTTVTLPTLQASSVGTEWTIHFL